MPASPRPLLGALPLLCRRPIVPRDAAKFSAWMQRDFPVPTRVAPVLTPLLSRLIEAEILRGTAVDIVDNLTSEPVLAGFGLVCFVTNSLAETYLAAPYPHLELELLDQAARGGGRGSFLDHDEVAGANAGDGLAVIPLLWLQRTNDPNADEARALMVACQQSFLNLHRGYRIASIIKEASANRAALFVAGGFRERCRLAIGTPLRFDGRTLQEEHVVLSASRSDFDGSMPGSAISHLFTHHPPRCGFTRAEKQVLCRAIDHLTDDEIAAALRIAPGAVALRWRSIYARLAERVPFALHTAAIHSSAARGREKRRRVVAFVGEFPEEIRPYPPL